MEVIPCSDRDLALPGGVLPAVWQLLCSYKPRARLWTSVTLKSKTLTEDLATSVELCGGCCRWQVNVWEFGGRRSASVRAGEVRDVFSTASWALDNTGKTSKETQLIHLSLANCYLDMHQRQGLGSQETQRIKKCWDGLEAWGWCYISNSWKHFLLPWWYKPPADMS